MSALSICLYFIFLLKWWSTSSRTFFSRTQTYCTLWRVSPHHVLTLRVITACFLQECNRLMHKSDFIQTITVRSTGE